MSDAHESDSLSLVSTSRASHGSFIAISEIGALLPGLASLSRVELHARRVRDVDRDAVDLWTCLELMAAAGEATSFGDAEFDPIRSQLAIDFADDGPVMRVAVPDLNESDAAHRRTRIRGLARAVE